MALPFFVGIIVRQALINVIKKYGKKRAIGFVRDECVEMLRLWLKHKTKGLLKYSERDILKAIEWFENPQNETAIELWLDPIGGVLENISSTRTESNIGLNPENILKGLEEAGKEVRRYGSGGTNNFNMGNLFNS